MPSLVEIVEKIINEGKPKPKPPEPVFRDGSEFITLVDDSAMTAQAYMTQSSLCVDGSLVVDGRDIIKELDEIKFMLKEIMREIKCQDKQDS